MTDRPHVCLLVLHTPDDGDAYEACLNEDWAKEQALHFMLSEPPILWEEARRRDTLTTLQLTFLEAIVAQDYDAAADAWNEAWRVARPHGDRPSVAIRTLRGRTCEEVRKLRVLERAEELLAKDRGGV